MLMTYVKVENGVVVNRAVFDGEMPLGWPEYASWVQNEIAQIGWTYDGTDFVGPPPAVDDTIYAISNRQFYQHLATVGVISQQEALEAVRGTVPSTFNTAVNKLAAGGRFNAQMFLASATLFPREHPVVEQFATAMGWSKEHTDQVWRDARKL
jgi:hypothetical protein